ncbi:hypothetical protein L227DRAFT_354877 [Lentinus tigrinus ALCF2SS1-6]|uniref:Uncharacterized protein n=1 Tax=Lentinus tigrinus ALCF2SS1-6 TaxID=1328759 RepID=A0A5C2RRG4_9APHY|nr:hypothetical protein L227DRAFT_354877 [Lentinus tigrinus ALCF2SS1-6]
MHLRCRDLKSPQVRLFWTAPTLLVSCSTPSTSPSMCASVASGLQAYQKARSLPVGDVVSRWLGLVPPPATLLAPLSLPAPELMPMCSTCGSYNGGCGFLSPMFVGRPGTSHRWQVFKRAAYLSILVPGPYIGPGLLERTER